MNLKRGVGEGLIHTHYYCDSESFQSVNCPLCMLTSPINLSGIYRWMTEFLRSYAVKIIVEKSKEFQCSRDSNVGFHLRLIYLKEMMIIEHLFWASRESPIKSSSYCARCCTNTLPQNAHSVFVSMKDNELNSDLESQPLVLLLGLCLPEPSKDWHHNLCNVVSN